MDTTCIDCGTCFHLAPDFFEEASDDRSYVKFQPRSGHEWLEAKRALISCPTNSIGVKNAPEEFKEAPIALPLLISGNVYYCGYTSRDSFGASTYFIVRSEGNVLIDSPRFNPALAREFEQMGGIKTMILTHKDDVADHELWARHFGCERVIHEDELDTYTAQVEKILAFNSPLVLDSEITLIPTPGHTKGHITILYQNLYLFTGDHIFFDQQSGNLRASRNVCWYDWQQQILSTEKLLNFSFQWILPGHGGWCRFDGDKMKMAMQELLEGMKK
ncbi:MAG TPA: MBL fold metallo-hydrolase [Bacteriovoracaceae bacterium]|nr:MBL fold metallo-hydrolase [Bacteriovoracaceae bacterium]